MSYSSSQKIFSSSMSSEKNKIKEKSIENGNESDFNGAEILSVNK